MTTKVTNSVLDLSSSTTYIGTTAITLNRTSGTQTLTGVAIQFPDDTIQTTAATDNGLVAGGGMFESSQTISQNYTITAGKSAMSIGPITVASGNTVTVPTGSRWVVL